MTIHSGYGKIPGGGGGNIIVFDGTGQALDIALRQTSNMLATNLLTAPFYYLLAGLSLIDFAFTKTVSVFLQAKSLGWALGIDPLVIDLDGDGIETISQEDGDTYFDVDGDMFRERTGWLKGDDGFLVLDSNGNGRVDDIGEMFGNRFQGGYDELRGYDTNADGKISIGDVIWSALQVWQDKDGDGETSRRVAVAANDNNAWPERTFRFNDAGNDNSAFYAWEAA